MCPEVRQIGPGTLSQVWNGARSRVARAPRDQDRVHLPDASRSRAEPSREACPICGMALEPRTVTVEEDNPELRDMTRRFWISLALTVPLLAIAMGSMLWPHGFMGSIDVERGGRFVVMPWSSILPWLGTIAGHARRPLVRLAILPARLGFGSQSQHQHVHADCNGHGRRVPLQRGGNTIPTNISRIVWQYEPQHGRSPRRLLRSRSGDHHAGIAGTGAGVARPQPYVERDPRAARSQPEDGAAFWAKTARNGTSRSIRSSREIACAFAREKRFRSMAWCSRARVWWTNR